MERTKKRSSKGIVIFLIVLLLAAAAFAGWYFLRATKYDVVFLAEDGSEVQSVRVKEGEKVALIDGPKKEGFVFTGWTLDGKEIDAAMTVETDLTLKPSYKKEVTVTFVNEDGTAFLQKKIAEGDKVAKPDTVPEVKDKAFVSWVVNGEEYDFSQPVKENVNIIAKMIDYVPPTSLTFAQKSYTVEVAKAVYAPASVTPVHCTEGITYESSQPYIFYVDEVGFVTGLNEGTAILTAKSGDLVATAEIKVTEVKAESISVKEGKELLIARGKTLQLNAEITPANVSNKEIKYTSSANSVATVDETGLIKAQGKGKCTVTVSAANGVNQEINVEVFVPVESISLVPNRSTISYDSGSHADVKAYYSPVDADINSGISWMIFDGSGLSDTYFLTNVDDVTVRIAGMVNSRTVPECYVSASVTNADGSTVSSDMVTLYGEPKLEITELKINNVLYTYDPYNPVVYELPKGPGSVAVQWTKGLYAEPVTDPAGLLGGGGAFDDSITIFYPEDSSVKETTLRLTTKGAQVRTIKFRLAE